MVFAARILSTRLRACRFSLLRCAHGNLIHRRSPPSPAGACAQICHYSLPSRAVQPLFYAGSDVNHRCELHRQIQTDVAAECLRRDSHPCWPEWSCFLESIAGAGYSVATVDLSAAEDIVPDFPAEHLGPASVCLTFARDRPTLLGMLRMSDIEVVVQNGTPFCFKDSDESQRRMRSYIRSGSRNELDMDKATMIDLMKYIVSYISNPTALDAKRCSSIELFESSLKNLLSELAKLSYGVSASSLSGSIRSPFIDEHEQPLRTVKKIEMKRGDWICQRCDFMNFARNVKCLECEEARPKRQFLNGEWECPQCDFFNYGRNTKCFRCECKRPGGISLGPINFRSGSGFGDVSRSVNADSVNNDLEKKLAANEEKAQRWFSKVSEVNSTSDMSSAMEDEDFPEIMPLRKGVNKFVVSTRKTPLERRLANSAQHQNNQSDVSNSVDETLKERIGRSLDQILGHSSAASESNNNMAYSAQTPTSNLKNTVVSHPYDHLTGEKTRDQAPVVSVSQRSETPDPLRYEKRGESNGQTISSQTWHQEPSWRNMDENSMVGKSTQSVGNPDPPREGPQQNWRSLNPWENKVENGVGNYGARKGQHLNENFFHHPTSTNASWSMRYPDQHSASVATNGTHVTGNSFQKGNNNRWGNQHLSGEETKFASNEAVAVRNSATDQFNPQIGSNGSWPNGSASENGTANGRWMGGNFSHTNDNGCANASFVSNSAWGNPSHNASNSAWGNPSQNSYDLQASSNRTWSSGYSYQANASFAGTQNVGNLSQDTFSPRANQPKSWNNGYSHYEAAMKETNMTGIPPQTTVTSDTNAQNTSVSWSGKSLEGSSIREPNALDMSEEAKAERWFKRVAEIKDISELSKIPDEDFPSIMPMRKGVNRFVVSKRKTPLERRLTSQQYRRNLPTVASSESLKNENENEE